MAADTRDKRAAAILISLPWRGLLPLSDGAVDQPDRQQVPFFYSGISATSAVAIVVGIPGLLTVDALGILDVTPNLGILDATPDLGILGASS